MADVVMPIQRQACSNGRVTCADASRIVAYSLVEQQRYGEAIPYLVRVNADDRRVWNASGVSDCTARDANLSIGGHTIINGTPWPIQDTFRPNRNWSNYQARKQANGKDFSQWLHLTYLCALFDHPNYRKRVWFKSSDSQLRRDYDVLLDGRVVVDGSFENDGRFDEVKYESEEIPDLYVAEVRQALGDADAATAQQFVDEIAKPLKRALAKLKKESENGSALQQQDGLKSAKIKAAQAALYDKAVTAARSRNFPSRYVDFLTAKAKFFVGDTKLSVEYGH